MLEMHPRGVTNSQLLWRLRSSGIRVSPTDLLDGLNALVQRGEVRRNPDGRWSVFYNKRVSSAERPRASDKGVVAAGRSALYAVAASHRPLAATFANDLMEALAPSSAEALPETAALLRYFAATQRQDPRGRIEEYADRHGKVWQLFHTRGHWWTESEITIRMEYLPDPFKESLMRRQVSSAAIGWPVSVFVTPEGAACLPALLIPVTWRLEGSELRVVPEAVAPSINPAWMRQAARNSSWSEEVLGERLFDTEDQGLAAIGDRIRHALATLGAGQLRPGDLAMEMSLTPQGIRNAAALFLSEDASFTKGAAADLETLAQLPREAWRGTALDGVLGNLVLNVDPVPATPVSDLTDTQLDAADSALNSALTVVQGPPGTGKSQVILSLLVSAILNGRSVLFAAKNHQALDEVEKRLRELVPEDPLLVRGRDADGERNVSFLDALNELARDAARGSNVNAKLDSDTLRLLSTARALAEKRARNRRLMEAHLVLSDLAERLELSEQKEGGAKGSIIASGLAAIARLFRRKQPADLFKPLPPTATRSELKGRRLQLAKRMEQLQAQSAPPLPGEANQTSAVVELLGSVDEVPHPKSDGCDEYEADVAVGGLVVSSG